MSDSSKGKPTVKREPIQVYLTADDRSMLDRAAAAAGLSRAEVLRLGLRDFSAKVLAEQHPVVEFLDAMAATSWPADMPKDAGRRHDEHLTNRPSPRRKARKA